MSDSAHTPFTVYDRATGEVIVCGFGSRDCAEAYLKEGREILFEAVNAARVYLPGGVPTPLPPKPDTPYHVFDYALGQWVDPRTIDSQWSEVRQERNRRLTACDWSVLPDVPMTVERRQQWEAYRQALRDVTEQPDPFSIVWPVPPT